MPIVPGSSPLRAAIYVRSATADQVGRGNRLEEQAAECRRLAGMLNADVIAEYRDIGAGTSWDLPGLQAVLGAARQHDLNIVLCERPDRLAHGSAKLFQIEEELARIEVSVRYAVGDPPERSALTAALASLEAPTRALRDEEA